MGTHRQRETSVGIDLGTSALKGVALSADGRTLAGSRSAYPTHRPTRTRAEQDPADWISALRDVLASLAKEVSPGSWSGLGLTGMIPTLVTLDARRRPNGPAITWQDARAEAEGQELRDRFGAEELYARTGQWVDGRYLLPMERWIERNEPERAASTVAAVAAKDHLYEWLTGERATDPSTATGFGCYDLHTRAWIEDLVSDVEFPEVRESSFASEILDDIADDLRLPRGLRVTIGAADSICAALAAGATESGDCAYVWGTSTVVLGVAEGVRLDPAHRFLITPLATGNRSGLEMDLLSTGAALSWVASLLGVDEPGNVLRLAEDSAPGANGVTFLPYLAFGEQGALWDPDLRGAIDGLTVANTRGDVARALVEAIAVESRRCVGVLSERGTVEEIRATGPITGETWFLQQLADATGSAIVTVELPSAAAAGAALIASGASTARRAGDTRIEPDLSRSDFWEERLTRIDDLRDRLRRVGD